MKENMAEAGAQHVKDVVDSNRMLVEKALRMRCLAYLSQAKSQLLMQTILNIGASKKEIVSLAQHLGSTVSELERQQASISQKNAELERKNSELEETRAQLEQTASALSVANETLRLEITERKRVASLLKQREATLQQQAAQLTEADRRKDDFIASLGHELRNALAPIHNMRRRYEIQGHLPAPEVKRVMDIIARQGSHLARLTDDLLDVTAITQGKIEMRKQTVDVRRIISEAVDIARPLIVSRNHELSLSVGKEPINIDADPVRLVQVVANLLLNAAKYTEQGGKILLRVEREGDEVVLSVRDTGVGIPSDLLPHVFETFVRGRRELERSVGGMGVGLSLARSLVELHGGSICASSPGRGQGSEFVLRLPGRIEDHGETEDAHSGAKQFVRRRILVVENDPDNAQSFALLLQAMGHEVEVVNEGFTALKVVEKRQPEVVFLDIGLPGMPGYDLARNLRERYGRNIRLIALTGYADRSDRLSANDTHFDQYLLKPVDVGALEDLLIS